MSNTNEELAKDRTSYAEERTDWAEDRTAMANERTFAGWMRTAFAAIGIGIGFNALFDELEPVWVPKAVATMFILLGIALTYLAQRRACHSFQRLSSHAIEKPKTFYVRTMSYAVMLGAAILIGALWVLHDK